MGYEHTCSFCGWRRPSATPVMLSPLCDRCGCALESVVAADPAPAVASPQFELPALVRAVWRPAGLALATLVLYTSAKVGYHQGGTAAGMTALGAGGFLLLPFVPERIGARGRSGVS